ncbi:MAG: hypothetical protein OEZ34_09290 [Spirochaetia bacterium]|nr:hypothetical protein [Spirochaetia bacterium]
MCRYANKTYKSHFACFSCRKAFKKTPLEDYVRDKGLESAYKKILKAFYAGNQSAVEKEVGISYAQIEKQYLEDVSPCPQCGEPMAAMGLDFKAPKNNDTEAWEIIAGLYEEGFAFQGCGCDVGYKPPKKLHELPEWLSEHVRKSKGEKLLESINAKNLRTRL